MLTVTQSACELLAQMLEEGDVPRSAALRIVTDTEGMLEMLLATPQLGDEVFSHAGRVVLAVDLEARRRLSQRTLDVVDTPAGPQLLPR